MPTSRELANKFNEKNIYDIDYDHLRHSMEKVMKRTNRSKLDNALKKTFVKELLAEAIDYEYFRRTNIYSAANGNLDPMLTERVYGTSNEIDFLLGYVKIATECAKEINPNYQPQFMLGMTQDDVKDFFNKQLGSYTRRDEARHDLINVHGVKNCMEDIEFSRADNNGNVRNYATAEEKEKGYIKETYIRKEIVKQELRNLGFWRKWFDRSRKAREMREFVKAAEKALKDVKFTKEGIKDAIADFNAPAVRQDDVKLTNQAVGVYYERKEPESIKNSMFAIGYRPNLNKINDHIKYANEIKAILKNNPSNLTPEAKEVFDMNFAKLMFVTNTEKGKTISASAAEKQFAIMEKTISQKHADYEPLTIDKLAPEVVAEHEKTNVKVDLNEKKNAPTEPKKEEPSISKEPIVKDTI